MRGVSIWKRIRRILGTPAISESADSRLLRRLHQTLRASGLPEVADVALEAGPHLMMCQRRLAMTAVVRDEQPGQLHAHVTSWLPNSSAPEGRDELEACVMGFGDTPDDALQEAAGIWLRVVGAPILSCIVARPLLAADHFDGREEWGIPGGHGFVGPFVVRGESAAIDLNALAASPAFKFDGYPADGRPHLAKVTLGAFAGRWQRTIEIDGHACLVSEEDWDGMPAPSSPVMCTRFAVFFIADRHAEQVPARNPD
jgi:hypothetical protein